MDVVSRCMLMRCASTSCVVYHRRCMLRLLPLCLVTGGSREVAAIVNPKQGHFEKWRATLTISYEKTIQENLVTNDKQRDRHLRLASDYTVVPSPRYGSILNRHDAYADTHTQTPLSHDASSIGQSYAHPCLQPSTHQSHSATGLLACSHQRL